MELSNEEVAALREVFARFDKNGDGRVTKLELDSMLRSLGLKLDDSSIHQLLSRSSDGCIAFDDFLEVVGPAMLSNPAAYGDEELAALFAAFDRDGNGYITAAELAHSMAKLGHPLSVRELSEMIRDADQDGDGRISFEEFVAALKGSAT